MSHLRSKLCLWHVPLIFIRANSALRTQNLCHMWTIKDQSLHGHIEDHESLCDQTGSLPCRGPITDLHSTKLRNLFSCHFHWVEGHSASSIKWLGPFKGLKRTKLSSLWRHRLTTTIGMKQREKGGEGIKSKRQNETEKEGNGKFICWIHLLEMDKK